MEVLRVILLYHCFCILWTSASCMHFVCEYFVIIYFKFICSLSFFFQGNTNALSSLFRIVFSIFFMILFFIFVYRYMHFFFILRNGTSFVKFICIFLSWFALILFFIFFLLLGNYNDLNSFYLRKKMFFLLYYVLVIIDVYSFFWPSDFLIYLCMWQYVYCCNLVTPFSFALVTHFLKFVYLNYINY